MSLRSEVLAAYRVLQRARQQVFKGDDFALEAGKRKIQYEFRENYNVSDTQQVKKLVKMAKDAATILRQHVVQGELNEDGVYKVKITKDTALQKNVPLKEENKVKKTK